MIDRILPSVRANWENIWPGASYPTDLRYTLQSRHRILLFLFDMDNSEKSLVGVVKASRREADNAVLDRSVELMGRIRKIVEQPILNTIPRAVLLNPVNGLSVSFEQAMSGIPMGINHLPWLAGRRHEANWDAWRKWLTVFQQQTLIRSTILDRVQIAKLAADPLNNVLKGGLISNSMQRDFSSLIMELEGTEIRVVWRYGDAHHSNILTYKRRITGVVDWEGSAANQLPTQDWFQFAFQYLVDSLRLEEPRASRNDLASAAVRILLNGIDSKKTNLASKQTDQFLRASGIDTRARSALLVCFLMQLHWPWGKKPLLEAANEAIFEK